MTIAKYSSYPLVRKCSSGLTLGKTWEREAVALPRARGRKQTKVLVSGRCQAEGRFLATHLTHSQLPCKFNVNPHRGQDARIPFTSFCPHEKRQTKMGTTMKPHNIQITESRELRTIHWGGTVSLL